MDIIKYDSNPPSRQNSAGSTHYSKVGLQCPIFEKQMHNARCLVRDLTGADIYEMGNNNPDIYMSARQILR